MRILLRASEAIDWLNAQFGRVANLLVLLACFVSAGNAMSRYAFSISSNGFLEIQWYMFAVMVMLGAAYTLRRNEHVRVEIFYLYLSERGRLWLDLIGADFAGERHPYDVTGEDLLRDALGVEPGAVTPYAAMNASMSASM